MPALKVLIVDDERPARAKVARLIADDTRFTIVGEAQNGIEALEQLERLEPDVVVLDITMPFVGGFEVLRAWGEDRSFDVIFSTASDAHAIRAFEENAADYLLKPYDATRMKRALDRVVQRHSSGGDAPNLERLLGSGSTGHSRRIVVRTDEGWVALDTSEITRVSAADKYVTIRVRDQTVIVRTSLRAIHERLPVETFLRVHRGEIVNIAKVRALEPYGHGDGLLLMGDGESVVLSRTYRQEFIEKYGLPSSGN